ncbi:LOW QUALITY PROTEIN: hypothetical protein CFOL_v3_27828, partial [Cephalotus follicularis]
MKASLKGRYEGDKSSAASALIVNVGDAKLRASFTDTTFIDGPSLNGVALALEKPGSFIIDYNVPKKDFRFQFMNTIRVAEKPLNMTYIHHRGDNRTILDGTLVFDSANKVSANHAIGSRNCKLKYTYLHRGLTTFEPCYDLAKNSWDFAVWRKVYDDDVFRASYQTSSQLLGLEWSRKSKVNGNFKGTYNHLHDVSSSERMTTRHATFKSLSLVQKPLSSILEKIRQRKQEIFRKSVSLSIASSFNDDEFYMDLEPGNAPIEEMEDFTAAKAASDETIAHRTDVDNNLDVLSANGSTETKTQSSHESIPSPVDLLLDSQTSDSKDSFPDDTPSSPLEEVLAPSLLALNLKLHSAPPEDISSDEENNNKENVDPHLHRSVDLSSSPNGDPVKAFVDDEAAEEDDSDNDPFRFQDNDEDEDAEELNNMIATGSEEKPIDVKKRNELHQKWLEQQDDARTEKFLQILISGWKQAETALIDEKDGEGEENNEESGDEAAEDLVTANVVTNLRKAKQMIAQMFTDLNDAYISSDDEETETRQVKQCLSEKAVSSY